VKNTIVREITIVAAAAAGFVCSGCGSSMEGTYSDPSRAVLLELKSGGKANITFMGDVEDCTYNISRPHLNLSCNGSAGNIVFTIHDDGSLTGPPGSFMPGLRKEKK
jgi:hypothetical protein